jgi:hypothetical protein
VPTATLLSVFSTPEDLLTATPEDLAAILLEIMPPLLQNGMIQMGAFTHSLYATGQERGYAPASQKPVLYALAEAMNWLETQGLIMSAPDQHSVGWFVRTRRAETLQTRADVQAYAKGRILPVELLPPSFSAKVVPIFRRGDHDVAVFQAFKLVEVAVRKAANAKGAGYPDSEVGTSLMRKAFHPETGPLTDGSLVPAEREAEMHLFSGAIGHAKNPPSHREVEIGAPEAAQLIIFASYLMGLVEQRR